VQDDGPVDKLQVTVHWGGFASGSRPMSLDGNFYGAVGPVTYSGTPNEGGSLDIWVTATDAGGLTTRLDGKAVQVAGCSPSIIG
jgi:putative peptide zinc metalloprotease protein